MGSVTHRKEWKNTVWTYNLELKEFNTLQIVTSCTIEPDANDWRVIARAKENNATKRVIIKPQNAPVSAIKYSITPTCYVFRPAYGRSCCWLEEGSHVYYFIWGLFSLYLPPSPRRNQVPMRTAQTLIALCSFSPQSNLQCNRPPREAANFIRLSREELRHFISLCCWKKRPLSGYMEHKVLKGTITDVGSLWSLIPASSHWDCICSFLFFVISLDYCSLS